MVNPDTVTAQMEGGIMFGLTAALYGDITLKNGRVEQSNFDSYQALRIDEAPMEVHLVESGRSPAASASRHCGHRSCRGQCHLCR